MFSLADVMNFFAHEFPGLGGGRFPLPTIFASPFQRFLFRHMVCPFPGAPAPIRRTMKPMFPVGPT
jgi:hypothetical protein